MSQRVSRRQFIGATALTSAAALAARAAQKFEAQRIQGSAVLNPVDEATWVSTNNAAQWGLAAIECLSFASSMADHTQASTPRFSGERRARD